MDQEKLKIALIAGGYSGEYTVSLSSQEGLMKFLSDSPYEIYPVLLRRDHWTVLGLEGDPEIDALVKARGEAKKAKNFAEADRIRDELKEKGIEITDVPGGAVWKRV